MREAELLEDLADRALVVSDAEALGHDLLQVHPAPAHDSMHGALRAGFNDLGELRQLLRREARPVAFRPAVLEPFWAPFIEAVHPVPQRLAVHATDPRGIGPAHPIQHRRKRQQTPTLVGVLGGRRKPRARRSKTPPSPSPLSPSPILPRHGISSTSRGKSPAMNEGRWYYMLIGTGGAHFTRGDYVQAVHWIEKGLREKPDAVWAYRLLSASYFYAGRVDDAKPTLADFCQAFPNMTVAKVLERTPGSLYIKERFAAAFKARGLPE